MCVMQTVQYIQPQHAAQLSQAELLVIDEAAAIPLPVVKTLLGPYPVFLCSTVNGYEGTGRSLSLKLIEQLRTEVNNVLSLRPPWQHCMARQTCCYEVFLPCLCTSSWARRYASRFPRQRLCSMPLSADLDLLSQAV